MGRVLLAAPHATCVADDHLIAASPTELRPASGQPVEQAAA
jgi:hypothetical protein